MFGLLNAGGGVEEPLGSKSQRLWQPSWNRAKWRQILKSLSYNEREKEISQRFDSGPTPLGEWCMNLFHPGSLLTLDNTHIHTHTYTLTERLYLYKLYRHHHPPHLSPDCWRCSSGLLTSTSASFSHLFFSKHSCALDMGFLSPPVSSPFFSFTALEHSVFSIPFLSSHPCFSLFSSSLLQQHINKVSSPSCQKHAKCLHRRELCELCSAWQRRPGFTVRRPCDCVGW